MTIQIPTTPFNLGQPDLTLKPEPKPELPDPKPSKPVTEEKLSTFSFGIFLLLSCVGMSTLSMYAMHAMDRVEALEEANKVMLSMHTDHVDSILKLSGDAIGRDMIQREVRRRQSRSIEAWDARLDAQNMVYREERRAQAAQIRALSNTLTDVVEAHDRQIQTLAVECRGTK